MIKIKSDKIILSDSLYDGFVYVEDGKIVDVCKEDRETEVFYDYTGKYVSPGFIDMHTHGGEGFAFFDSSVEDVINGCNFHLTHGTTSILPTISAAPFDGMRRSVEHIGKAKTDGRLKGNIIGAHLEGPYLSQEQCGAQFPDYITPPQKQDYVKLVEDFGEYISRWTYAPENDEGAEFCKYLTKNGIIASAGHTNAKYDDIKFAFDNGCNLITHLYSCTSTITRDHGFRSLGVIESAYLLDDMFVEIIADGKHLPINLIKLIVKIKGEDRVALITDSLEIAGTDIKSGIMCGTEFIVEDGVCKLKDRSAFAGSIATSDVLIKTALSCGFSITKAVKMLTEVPANILKINKGRICKGYDADIIVFDHEINVSNVMVNGKIVL